ncbi:MAG: molecular chaperone DnaJ [Methyloligella sp.]|nr:MAG: molecular chaperone DnaJ [Methyloligella sp.]
MKLTSKYFDSIRVKPEDDRSRQEEGAKCNWRSCERPGKFPAPKGRDKEGEYYLFCQHHVREYNKKYNYFVGMDADDIVDYQKENATGHRPTWAFKEKEALKKGQRSIHDPLNFIDEDEADTAPKTAGGRRLRNMERKSLDDLGLPASASKDDIKTRYKELVKRHHPDLNGGDRNSEEKLAEVINAYNYLKKVGMV